MAKGPAPQAVRKSTQAVAKHSLVLCAIKMVVLGLVL